MVGGVNRWISRVASAFIGYFLVLTTFTTTKSNALNCHFCVTAPKLYDCRSMPVGNEDTNPKMCLKIVAKYDNGGGMSETMVIRRGRHTLDFAGKQITDKCITVPLSYLPENYIPVDATFTSVEVCGCASDYCNAGQTLRPKAKYFYLMYSLFPLGSLAFIPRMLFQVPSQFP